MCKNKYIAKVIITIFNVKKCSMLMELKYKQNM